MKTIKAENAFFVGEKIPEGQLPDYGYQQTQKDKTKVRDVIKKLKSTLNDKTKEPKPDIAICSICGWRGDVSECIKGEDGDWESGYYEIDECPKCEDGGCIDDYDMSEQRLKEWEEWAKERGI